MDAVSNKETQVLIVTGTRPEIIKMAPVYHELQRQHVAVKWCHSGQHDSLAFQAFATFDVTPDIVLDRPEGQDLASLAAGLLHQLNTVIQHHAPTTVLVHGDTSSTLAAATAAFYNQTPLIGHVEAGLRSGDLHHPFPEEANRREVAVIANLHYAPTQTAYEALRREDIAPSNIVITGNTAIDAQLYLLNAGKITLPETRHTVLVTAHRRENWDNMATICQAVNTLAEQHPSLHFVFATHANPLVSEQVKQHLAERNNIERVAPMDYLDLQQTIANCALVLTDSGGIQEEAPTFHVPVVVLRERTERPEACDLGFAALAGASDLPRILRAADAMMQVDTQTIFNPFGRGEASKLIAADIKERVREFS